MRIRQAMKEIRIQRLDYTKRDLVLTFDPGTHLSPTALVLWAQRDPRVRLTPGDRLVFRIGILDAHSRIDKCLELMGMLHRAAEEGADALPTIDPADIPREQHPHSLKKRHDLSKKHIRVHEEGRKAAAGEVPVGRRRM